MKVILSKQNMVMRPTLIFGMLLVSTVALCQVQPPNYEGIKKIITVKESPFYYPSLFERYRNNDTTLTVQEYRILYYGYIYQPKYDPYGLPTYFDSLKNLLSKKTLTTNDYHTIIDYETKVLNEFPFDLREISMLAHAYDQTNQADMGSAIHNKFEKLTQAILSTGNGLSKETAMHVIANSHEYDILNFLGLTYAGEQSQGEDTWEYLKVKPNKFKVEGIYFNIKEMFKHEVEAIEKK